MIEIDGAIGEGGGQVLRTSVALSAVTQQPVRIKNIRAGRPNPGLSRQHVTSVQAVAKLCDAAVDGLCQGAQEIVFRPGALLGGEYRFDIGTAGSIPLVAISCLLPAAMSRSGVDIVITGGSDVKWSPPIDYITMVHARIAGMFGLECSAELVSRGFYPEGGGVIRLEVAPSGGLHGVILDNCGRLNCVRGIAFSQNLPDHVVERVRHAAMRKLVSAGEVRIDSDVRRGHSTGAGIVLIADFEGAVIGESALGEKGVRAETLGEGCAADLLETIASGATVDRHMLDQVLPYMAVARGPSAVVAEALTAHAETNIAVIRAFVDREFSVMDNNGLVEVAVD